MLGGSALSVAAMMAAWAVLVGVGGASAARVAMPPEMIAGFAAFVALASPLALVAAVRTVLSVWRGPSVVSFAAHAAVRCGRAEADWIRDGAQLRGTMGGAGYVHRSRLAFPIVAWTAALAAGAQGVFAHGRDGAGAWTVGLAVSAALVAWVLPARPFWYREVTGGGVVVSPPEAAVRLAARGLAAGPREAPSSAAAPGAASPADAAHGAAPRAPAFAAAPGDEGNTAA